jgi:hypothetical protein
MSAIHERDAQSGIGNHLSPFGEGQGVGTQPGHLLAPLPLDPDRGLEKWCQHKPNDDSTGAICVSLYLTADVRRVCLVLGCGCARFTSHTPKRI